MNGGYLNMGKMASVLIAVSLFAACAGGNRTQTAPQGIVFETGKSRRAVMDTIVEVAMDDGYTIDSTSDADGTIICNPRKMLDGTLSMKITGNDLALQSKRSTLNHLIQFSARVSRDGVVELKTLVMVSGLKGPVDMDRSEKLARYYEKKIMKVLRTPAPKLLMRTTDGTA
jgi:hypothetical protein